MASRIIPFRFNVTFTDFYDYEVDASTDILTYKGSTTFSQTVGTGAKAKTYTEWYLGKFREVTGLEDSIESVTWKTGMDALPCEIPTFSNPGDITLRKGIEYNAGAGVLIDGSAETLIVTEEFTGAVRRWATECLGVPGFYHGTPTRTDVPTPDNNLTTSLITARNENPQRTLIIEVLNKSGEQYSPRVRLYVYNAVISNYMAGDLNSDASDPWVEEITISHSGFSLNEVTIG